MRCVLSYLYLCSMHLHALLYTNIHAHTLPAHTIIYTHAHTSDEELRQLRKVLNEFTFEITQLNSQLELIHREKGALQSKSIETERMHIQMKEALSAEISYLRQLNLQLIEQHMKSESSCLSVTLAQYAMFNGDIINHAFPASDFSEDPIF